MSLALLAFGALAAEPPVCGDAALPTPPDTLSVAWVSPLRKRARGGTWLALVPTADLRTFVRAEGGGSVARMLQRVGLRERSKEPRRRYKVVVFDVRASDLCRPLVGGVEGELHHGVRACDERRSDPDRATAGCGFTIDRATGAEGSPLYRARWNDVAGAGFCVLPAERFVGG